MSEATAKTIIDCARSMLLGRSHSNSRGIYTVGYPLGLTNRKMLFENPRKDSDGDIIQKFLVLMFQYRWLPE
jgi:hypothetical protein